MHSLRGKTGTQDHQWTDRGSDGLHKAQILRPQVHGSGDGERSLHQRQPQPVEGAQTSQGNVRGVRDDGKDARPPHRQGPFQQHSIELEDVVPVLSSQIALAELHGRWRDASALRSLCEAICEKRALPFTPEQAAAVWESLSREDQDSIRMDFGHIWVARAFTPLSKGEPARVMRLRGYGNAIVPQVAAEFIRAVM
jgi:hypothetical protein